MRGASFGRFAFARGNSAWARNFNRSLLTARGMAQPNLPMGPASWRILSSASATMMNKARLFSAAAEMPVSGGFAEQTGNMQSGMLAYAQGSDEDICESSDDVAEALAAVPTSTTASIMRSLSDVIVFGTNCIYHEMLHMDKWKKYNTLFRASMHHQ